MEPVVIATADVPNKNDRVYSRVVLDRAIQKCDGFCYGQLGMPIMRTMVPMLEDVSHVVENIRFDDNNRLIGNIRVLKTPSGATLQQLLDSECKLDFRLAGVGDAHTTKDGVTEITNFSICSINAVSDGA